MFSSQACSVFRSHHVLSSCNWSSSARSLTRERGSTVFGIKNSLSQRVLQSTSFIFFTDENPSESLLTEKAHPKQRLIWALVSLLFFFPTGSNVVFLYKENFSTRSLIVSLSFQQLSHFFSLLNRSTANEMVITNKR